MLVAREMSSVNRDSALICGAGFIVFVFFADYDGLYPLYAYSAAMGAMNVYRRFKLKM